MGYFLNLFFTGLSPSILGRRLTCLLQAGAMTLQATMQGRACQMGNRGLQGIQAVIQGQQRMLAEGHNHSLLCQR